MIIDPTGAVFFTTKRWCKNRKGAVILKDDTVGEFTSCYCTRLKSLGNNNVLKTPANISDISAAAFYLSVCQVVFYLSNDFAAICQWLVYTRPLRAMFCDDCRGETANCQLCALFMQL